jgi:hypothetical protein
MCERDPAPWGRLEFGFAAMIMTNLTLCSGEWGQELPDGYILANPDSGVDRRTAAEKRHDELMAKKEAERVKKWAAKSHRERINEFNNYLQDLSEHHDIPKVGPG